MNHYVDIKLVQSEEISNSVIMNAIFDRFHMFLVKSRLNIAVSFPRYDKENRSFGHILRLHGDRADLEGLTDGCWLRGDADYCVIGQINSVPEVIDGHVVVKRVRGKTMSSRLNRLVKKGKMTEQKRDEILSSHQKTLLSCPFLKLNSRSTGDEVLHFVSQDVVEGDFENNRAVNGYGMSTKESLIPVPMF